MTTEPAAGSPSPSAARLQAFDSLDRLSTVELRPPNLPGGHVARLYDAARGGGDPISRRIAVRLGELDRSRVAIFTGVVIPPHLPMAEIDGPIGAIVLGRSLAMLGHDVEVVVESCQVGPSQELVAQAGVDGVAVVDGALWTAHGARLGAAIAIEKISANRRGVRHSVLGTPIDAGDPATDRTFTELLARGVLTIGIGDAGNEIGFGSLQDEVAEILGRAAACRCGCPDGIVAATATELVLPAAISNLGAYGLAAALSLHLERAELGPTPELVSTLIEAAPRLGFLDGATLDPDFRGDDGVPLEALRAFVIIMGAIVDQSLRDMEARPF
jgi:hypothetical protein